MGLTSHCCDPGAIWEGEPKGNMVKIAQLDTYVVEPKHNTSRAVLLLHDAFGLSQHNIKLIADRYAKAGYLSVVPDFLHSDPLSSAVLTSPSQLGAWFQKHPVGSEKTLQEIDEVLQVLKEEHNIKHVAAEGFCWGGWYAVHLASTDKVDCISVAHGSVLKAENIEAIQKPSIFLCAEVDTQITDSFRAEIQRILSKKPFPNRVKLYPNTTHGFAVRAKMDSAGASFSNDLKEPTSVAATDAIKESIEWFDEHTGKKADWAKSVGLAATAAVLLGVGIRAWQQHSK